MNIRILCLLTGILIWGVALKLHAQATNIDWGTASDDQVLLQAIELTSPTPSNEIPGFATFYSAQHSPICKEPWPPLPADIEHFAGWDLGSNIWVLDDLDFDYNAPRAQPNESMRAMDDSGPPIPGGGDGGGGAPPSQPPPIYYNYGSNLWIQCQGIVTNAFIAMASNTEPDIQYEVDSSPSLSQTNWHFEEFIYGSEVTNWTPFSVNLSGRTNNALFFRIRSWIDSHDMGIPDWWQLKYFGYVGIDPYGDPAGDGYSNLYKYQNGLNPFAFYAAPPPVADAAPVAGDNGVTISWDPAQGNVLSYGIYRNGTLIATVSSTTLSYTDSSVSIDLTDPNDLDFPSYDVAANYAGGPIFCGSLAVASPRLAIATGIVRGPGGQQILLAPNIPNGSTSIRVYYNTGQGSASYPDAEFQAISYLQTSGYLASASNYFDIPVSDFTNSEYVIPPSLLSPYNVYSVSCRALGANGVFGPDNPTELNSVFPAESEGSCLIPFVDGTEQLKENLAFELEAADENNPFAFGVFLAYPGEQYPEPPDYISPANYAYAGFYIPYDLGETQLNYAFLDPFKPFEDNYFLRNFVYAYTNLNSDGSLASGVYYDYTGYLPPIQIPAAAVFSFPEYDFVTTGNTNDLQPQMSAVENQWIYTAYEPNSPGQGNIGINEVGTNLFLGSGQDNIFGLPYESAIQTYSDGSSLYTNTLYAGGGSVPDESGASSQYFYGQVASPHLQTVGYFFGVPFQDYLPGNAGFNPTNTGPGQPQVLAVGEPLMMTAWAKEHVANGASGAVGFLEQYFGQAYLGDANGDLDISQPTGILSPYGEFFATQPGKTFLTTVTDTNGNQGQVPVYTIALCTDVNRDGTIDPSFGSPDFTTPAHPFHFWVNDNNDSGDTGGNDIPGYPATMDQTPNGLSGHINGTRDLIDFFPVYIDIHDLLEAMQTNQTYAGLQFVLSQADGALNFAYAQDSLSNAESYLTDTNFAFFDQNYPVNPIPASGVVLGDGFLENILNGGSPVILVEAWTNTSNPLVLSVFQGTNIICQAPLYLNITGVEQMFRQKNLTGAVLGAVAGPADRLNDYDVPNEPDTTDKNFIFLHGYNVNPNEARGTDSAMFKRMFWSGSDAKFYGVTWDGYASQQNLLGLLEITPNYHTNVANAFVTAPYLANFINGLSGTNTLAAHSLGNMVALSAISDWSANVQDYLMMDAAVPMEAIDPNAVLNAHMIESDWDAYANKLYASDWWQLWSPGDARSSLTWDGRLDNFNGANVYNFYSSGEDVLREYDSDAPVGSFGAVSLLLTYWNQHPPLDSFVWVWQEKSKGIAPLDSILGSTHGGWKFNSDYDTNGMHMPDSGASLLPNSELETNAFFDFASSSFTADLALEGSGGSAYAAANRNRILSDAIPALTLPVGANPVPDPGIVSGNFDMQALYENGWPASRSTGSEAFKWHHSDFQVVAYLYTHQLFNKMVTLGNLK